MLDCPGLVSSCCPQTALDLEEGDTITVDIEGLRGSVKVCRIVPAADAAGRSFYGLEFVSATAELARQVHYRLVGRIEPTFVDVDDVANA